MMRWVYLSLALAVPLCVLSGPAGAQDAVPAVIPYSGFLELPDNAVSANLQVRLQRENQAGQLTTVWCEQHPDTPLHQRRFHINIGRPAGNPAPCADDAAFALEGDFHSLFAKGQVWLGVWVNGSALTPQQFLTMYPTQSCPIVTSSTS